MAIGWTHDEAIPPYRQTDPRASLYAALLAIRNIYASRQFDATDEARIVEEAEHRELLGSTGAETGRGYTEQQAALIQGMLRLTVRFIDHSDVGIASELSQALRSDQQVVLGRPAPHGKSETEHWVGLDGIKKSSSQAVSFTGMDTANAQRIECTPEEICQSLLESSLPLVVVEGYDPAFRQPNRMPNFSLPTRPRIKLPTDLRASL